MQPELENRCGMPLKSELHIVLGKIFRLISTSEQKEYMVGFKKFDSGGHVQFCLLNLKHSVAREIFPHAAINIF